MRSVTLQREKRALKDLALAIICVGRVALAHSYWPELVSWLHPGESWKVPPSLWKEISWISVGSRSSQGEKESVADPIHYVLEIKTNTTARESCNYF